MQNSKLAYKRIGVLLCRCEGKVTEKINLEKVSEWLKKDHYAKIIKTSDVLCKKPNEISAIIKQHNITNITIGACKRYQELFEEAAEKANLKPFCTKTVGLIEQCLTVHLKEHAEEKAKIILSAAISYQKQFSEIPSENLRFMTHPLDKKMDRRSFLTFPLKLRAKVIPTVTHSLCMVMQGCDLCINTCPRQAITEQKRKLQIDASKCESCAICSVTCPREAIFFPLHSLTQIDEGMRSLISANSGFLEPRVLFFTCRGGLSLLNELADKGLSYSANLMVMEVPCIGLVTPFIILRAFDLGVAGLGIVSCQERCQYGYDLNLMLENVQITSKLLRILGIGSERVCAIISHGNDTLAFHTQLKTFTEKVMQMDIQPLREKKPSELKNLENPLSYLVRQIVGKLNSNKNIQFQDAKLPFGIVEVDAKECSVCGLCASHCPTNAINLKNEMELVKLLFNYNLCIACGICLKRCPQKAMHIKKLLALKRFEQPISILLESKTVKCQLCNIAFLPERQVEVVSNLLPDKSGNCFQLISKYCPDCRVKAWLNEIKEHRLNTHQADKL